MAIAVASIYTLIPYHNVLKEPCYWYEFQIVAIVVYVPLLTWCSHPLLTVYYVNLPIKNKWFTYLTMYTIACVAWITVIGIYYYHYDNVQPMPMNLNAATSATYVILTFAVLLG